jgi:sulfur carrier protein ThiS
MAATIRLGASLKNLLGSKGEYTISAGQNVHETLISLGIKPELVAMVTVDNEMQTKDYLIQDGDTVMLMAVIGGG